MLESLEKREELVFLDHQDLLDLGAKKVRKVKLENLELLVPRVQKV